MGPLPPSSMSASLFGDGVRVKITAPMVPTAPGNTGGTGIKNGRVASMPRQMETSLCPISWQNRMPTRERENVSPLSQGVMRPGMQTPD
jgi:hypothetical protein